MKLHSNVAFSNRIHPCIAAVLSLLVFMMAMFLYEVPSAWASNGVFAEPGAKSSLDTAGNFFASDYSVHLSQDVERDAALFGSDVSVDSASVGGDILAAGQTVDVKNANVAGDVRAAGNTVMLEDTSAAGNISVVASEIQIGSKVESAAVHAAGTSINFAGTVRSAYLMGENVSFDGTVDGDVTIAAKSVTIGEHAKVTGTLHVLGSQPTVGSKAQVGSIDVSMDNESKSHAKVFSQALINALFTLFSMIVTIAVIFWLAPRRPQDALFMLQARPGRLILSGIVAMLAFPIAALVLMVSGVGALLGVVLICSASILLVMGLPFMCAVIAKRLMSNASHWVLTVLGAAIAGLITTLPALEVAGVLCGCIFLTGYVAQIMFLKLQARYAPKQEPPHVTSVEEA